TAVFVALLTVAVNCCVPFGNSVALVGETLTLTGCGAVMVTVAVALLVVSATLVAFTVKLPVVAPAVKRPAGEIGPPVAVPVTRVLVEPVTVAVNCLVELAVTEADVGEIDMETIGVALTATVVLAVVEPPLLVAVRVYVVVAEGVTVVDVPVTVPIP